jgi:hypothetical protein
MFATHIEYLLWKPELQARDPGACCISVVKPAANRLWRCKASFVVGMGKKPGCAMRTFLHSRIGENQKIQGKQYPSSATDGGF